MQHEIPQNLDIKDKIFGPLTFAQFVYLAGGAGFTYLVIRFVPFFNLILAPVIVGLALALAFYKINGRPFSHILESAVKYFIRGKIYLWQFRKERPKLESELKVKENPKPKEKLPESKLVDLQSGLNILDE